MFKEGKQPESTTERNVINRAERGKEPEIENVGGIEQLAEIIEKPENREKLHRTIVENQYVVEAGLEPTEDQIVKYCKLTKEGFEYAGKTFGTETIPKISLVLGRRISGIGTFTDFVFYEAETGTMYISALHIAAAANCIGDSEACLYESHLRGYLAPESSIKLTAIEECHHRKFFMENPEFVTNEQENSNGTDRPELEWKKATPKVMKDLGIKLISPERVSGENPLMYDEQGKQGRQINVRGEQIA